MVKKLARKQKKYSNKTAKSNQKSDTNFFKITHIEMCECTHTVQTPTQPMTTLGMEVSSVIHKALQELKARG